MVNHFASPIPQLTFTTAASGKDDTLEPGKSSLLSVTITNPDFRHSLDVDILLEGLPPDITLSSEPIRPRLALFPLQSEEVVFKLQASTMALPRVITYSLQVTDPNRNGQVFQDFKRQLRILPVDRTEYSIEGPSFYLEPATSSSHPLTLQPLAGAPIQVWVNNRSDLVDRFRLRCDGLPNDWEVTLTYPQDALGLGLMVAATSLGLNPGDRGQILLMIKPPAYAQSGSYVPTLQLSSENQPGLKLLHLLYLEVSPTYLLQPSLQSLRSQFRQGSALFDLQLSNNGNSPREVELAIESLDESDRYDHQLKATRAKILPQATQSVEIEVHPRRKWRRPLYGSGHFSNFRVKIRDIENHPLTPETLQGNFTWLPRPWWQLLLGVLILVGLLGGGAALIWWFWLRPTPPKVLFFETANTSNLTANGEFAKVNFQIRNPQHIQTMRLTGYDLEGKILSDPIEYDFQNDAQPIDWDNSDSLPHGLKTLCNLTPRQNLLTCDQVHTGASLPGVYVFELEVLYKNKWADAKLSERSSNVTIPGPTVRVFRSKELAYLEPVDNSLPNSQELEPVSDEGISLELEILHPRQLDMVKLVGKTQTGDVLGEELYTVWESKQRNDLSTPQAGEDEKVKHLSEQNCRLSNDQQRITCANFASKLYQVGTFQLELILISSESIASQDLVKVVSDPITIYPLPIAIETFTIRGENAQPKYIIPVDQSAPNSENPPGVKFEWEVSGGSTLKVELLLPDPLTVDPKGTLFLPLITGEQTTITLQATDGFDNTISRSVEIEAVDPTPIEPTDVAAAAANAAVEALQSAGQEAASDGMPFGTSSPVDPQNVSPTEQPPRLLEE